MPKRNPKYVLAVTIETSEPVKISELRDFLKTMVGLYANENSRIESVKVRPLDQDK